MRRVALVSMVAVDGGWSIRRFERRRGHPLEMTHEGRSDCLTAPVVEEFRQSPPPTCELAIPRLAGLGL